MRTGCQVVILVTVVIVVSIIWTPSIAQVSSCEFSPTTGQSCYYTLNAYCDANYGCWTLRATWFQGQYYEEWYYIYPARVGYSQCYAYGYNTGQWTIVTSVAVCNPQTLY
jgi:hypothetical protein